MTRLQESTRGRGKKERVRDKGRERNEGKKERVRDKDKETNESEKERERAQKASEK